MIIEILLVSKDYFINKKLRLLLNENINLVTIENVDIPLENNISFDLIILDLDILEDKYNGLLFNLSKIRKFNFVFLTSKDNKEIESIVYKLKTRQYIKKNISTELFKLHIGNVLSDLRREKLLKIKNDLITNEIETSQISKLIEKNIFEIKNIANTISIINSNLRFKIDTERFNHKLMQMKLLDIDKQLNQLFLDIDILTILNNRERIKSNVVLVDVIDESITLLKNNSFLRDIDISIKNNTFNDIYIYKIDLLKILLTIIKICAITIKFMPMNKKLYIVINEYSFFQTIKIFYNYGITKNNPNLNLDLYLCDLLLNNSGNRLKYKVKKDKTSFFIKITPIKL